MRVIIETLGIAGILASFIACGNSSAPANVQPGGGGSPGSVPSTLPSSAPSTTPSAGPVEVKAGKYGGHNFEADVRNDNAGVSFRFACAQGEVPGPLMTDDQGHFDAQGTYQITGGPTPVSGFPSHPAHYFGSVVNDQMTLEFTYTDSSGQTQHGGPVTGQYGQSGVYNVLCARPQSSPQPGSTFAPTP
jgi:hypothetical protein